MPVSRNLWRAATAAATATATSALALAGQLNLFPGASIVASLASEVKKECDKIQAHQDKAFLLGLKVSALAVHFDEQRDRIEGSSLEPLMTEIQSNLEDIHRKTSKWATYNFFKRWVKAQEIGKGLDKCNSILETCLIQFQTGALSVNYVKIEENGDLLQKIHSLLLQIKARVEQPVGHPESQIPRAQRSTPAHLQALSRNTFIRPKIGRVPLQVPVSDKWNVPEFKTLLQVSEDDYITTQHNEFHRGTAVIGGSLVKVAVKALHDPSAISKECFLNEMKVWRMFNHPNILPLLGYITTATSSICLVSEWQNKGDITTYCKYDPDCNAIRLLASAALGLDYLHKFPAVHGNVKGTNILVNEKIEAVIYDFQVTRILSDADGSELIYARSPQSPRWTALELFVGVQNVDPSDKSDVWAFGMAMVEVLTGERPLNSYRSNASFVGAIMDGKRPERPGPTIQSSTWALDGVWEIVLDCLSQEPQNRPSMDDVAQRLLEQADIWDKLPKKRRYRTMI